MEVETDRLEQWQQIADIAHGLTLPNSDPGEVQVLTTLRWDPSWTPELTEQRNGIQQIFDGQ